MTDAQKNIPAEEAKPDTASLRRPARLGGRHFKRAILLLGVPGIAIAAGVALWLHGGRHVTTENAYVKADIVQISAEITGRVASVAVADHASVKAGDVLIQLDKTSFETALLKAEAEVDSTRRQVAMLRAAWRESESELADLTGRQKYWESQFERQQQLAKRGIVASIKLEEAANAAAQSRDKVNVAKSKVARMLAALGEYATGDIDRHPIVREKLAALAAARLDLTHTTIRAPVSGRAVNVKLQRGEQVKAATPLIALVADARPWVEANFKETELTHIRPGQAATVVLDIYPDTTWQAEITSISPATGAEFALLPPQNASGNWIKVVQRLPVKFRLLPREGEPPLRAGMTATVTVDTRRERSLATLFGGWRAFAFGKPGQPDPSKQAATSEN